MPRPDAGLPDGRGDGRDADASAADPDGELECWARPGGCPWPLACDGPLLCYSRSHPAAAQPPERRLTVTGVDRRTPPADWPGLEMAGMTRLTDGIYYGWLANEANPMFWHRCAALEGVPEDRTVHGPWVAAGTGAHTLVSREPLHLEPSLLWRCCGLHGFVRDGAWIPA